MFKDIHILILVFFQIESQIAAFVGAFIVTEAQITNRIPVRLNHNHYLGKVQEVQH